MVFNVLDCELIDLRSFIPFKDKLQPNLGHIDFLIGSLGVLKGARLKGVHIHDNVCKNARNPVLELQSRFVLGLEHETEELHTVTCCNRIDRHQILDEVFELGGEMILRLASLVASATSLL